MHGIGLVNRMHMHIRPRRNRKNPAIRAMLKETIVTPADLIYPLFVQEGDLDEPLSSMPGCVRWSIDGLVKEAESAHKLGVPAVVLFPAIKEELKTPNSEESYNDDGLIPRVIKRLKQEIPTLQVITDVALDPYNSEGHDGLIMNGASGEVEILNDATIEVLCKQALCHARAGADIVAPSDMMDGRVEAIRKTLDTEGYQNISIMSYTAKYASAFYGPFRGALNSTPKAGDKKTYQMETANSREALHELELDEQEGADFVIVKPAGPYLDIIAMLRENTYLPVVAYQVSGEYLMMKSAVKDGWLDEKSVVIESLTSIKRAGADIILTYFAKDFATWYREGL